MSRRDTIIIAVLVNAALLMILFATSSKTDDVETLVVQKNAVLATSNEPQAVEIDPLEEVLSQYVKAPIESARQPTEIVIPATELCVVEPVKPTPKPASSDPMVSITVKKGDVLEKIARANGSSVAAIMETNHLTSTQLKIGQVLQVPLSSQTKVAKSRPLAPEEYYVVKDGDNPWLIASKNHIRLEELLRINGLDEAKARRLRPGDKLRLR